MSYYTREELIKQWLDKYPEEKDHEDLEFNALAGYVQRSDGSFFWASYDTLVRRGSK